MKTSLFETVYSPDAKIDTEAGVIRNVKILGRESRNGRKYSDRALDDAARLYEGAEINIDHDRKDPHRERGLFEGFGVVRGSKRQGDAVFGDVHYLKTHPAAPLVIERAQRFPDKIGLSHNADGNTHRDKGTEIVESITRVNSVDLVRNPATNKGLFESDYPTAKQILETIHPEKAKTTGLLEMEYASANVGVDGDMSGDQQMLLALEGMIVAVLRSETIDLPAKKQQISKILDAFGSLAGGESGEEKPPEQQAKAEPEASKEAEGDGSEPPFKKEKDMAESVKPETITKLEERVNLLETENAKLKKQEQARALMAEAGLQEDAALLESLVLLPDEAAMKKLCEREKELQRPAVGNRAKPLIESKLQREAIAEYPKDTKSFAAALR